MNAQIMLSFANTPQPGTEGADDDHDETGSQPAAEDLVRARARSCRSRRPRSCGRRLAPRLACQRRGSLRSLLAAHVASPRGSLLPSLHRAGPTASTAGAQAMPKQKTCRYDSSLGLLTKKFVTLIQTAPEGILDLNQARHEPCPRAPRISRGTPQRAALPEHTAAARAFPRN